MRTMLTYIMAFPRRSVLMLLALLVAGIAEGLSLTTLLPLLSAAVGNPSQSGPGHAVVQQLARLAILHSRLV